MLTITINQGNATTNQDHDAERQLVAAGQSGDVSAFNQLVRLYERRVYHLCYRMLGDAESAADATQDAFLAAFRNLRSFRGGAFASWMLRIAANTCYDVLRARKRRPTISLNAPLFDDDDGRTLDPPDTGELPDAFALRRELSAGIQHALAQIPPDQRVILIMSDIQGMAYEEIVRASGLNLGTVKSRLSRGRARLRTLLKAGGLLPSRYA